MPVPAAEANLLACVVGLGGGKGTSKGEDGALWIGTVDSCSQPCDYRRKLHKQNWKRKEKRKSTGRCIHAPPRMYHLGCTLIGAPPRMNLLMMHNEKEREQGAHDYHAPMRVRILTTLIISSSLMQRVSLILTFIIPHAAACSSCMPLELRVSSNL
eukprot:scaffold84495_cov17-Tisochrysis_lutea.AAC.1